MQEDMPNYVAVGFAWKHWSMASSIAATLRVPRESPRDGASRSHWLSARGAERSASGAAARGS